MPSADVKRLQEELERCSSAATQADSAVAAPFFARVSKPVHDLLGSLPEPRALVRNGGDPAVATALEPPFQRLRSLLYRSVANEGTFLDQWDSVRAELEATASTIDRLAGNEEPGKACRESVRAVLDQHARVGAQRPAIAAAASAAEDARARWKKARLALERHLREHPEENQAARYGQRDRFPRTRVDARFGRVLLARDAAASEIASGNFQMITRGPPQFFYVGDQLAGLKTAQQVIARLALEYDYYQNQDLVAPEIKVTLSFAQGARANPGSKAAWLEVLNRVNDWNGRYGQQRSGGQADERVLSLPGIESVQLVRFRRFPWAHAENRKLSADERAQNQTEQRKLNQAVRDRNRKTREAAEENATEVAKAYQGIGRWNPSIRRGMTAKELAAVDRALADGDAALAAAAAGDAATVAKLTEEQKQLAQRRSQIVRTRELEAARVRDASGKSHRAAGLQVQVNEAIDQVSPTNEVSALRQVTVYASAPAGLGQVAKAQADERIPTTPLALAVAGRERAPVKSAANEEISRVDLSIRMSGKAGALANPAGGTQGARLAGGTAGARVAAALPLSGQGEFPDVLSQLVAQNATRMFAATAIKVHRFDLKKRGPGADPLADFAAAHRKPRGEALAVEIAQRRRMRGAESVLSSQLDRIEIAADHARPLISPQAASLQAAVARLDAQLAALRGLHGQALASGARGVGQTLGDLASIARTMGYQSAGVVRSIQKLVDERRDALARLASGLPPDGRASARDHARLDQIGRQVPGLTKVMRPRPGVAQKGRGLSALAFAQAHESARRRDSKGLFEAVAPGAAGALAILGKLRGQGYEPRLSGWFSSVWNKAKSYGSSALHAVSGAAHAVGGLALAAAKSTGGALAGAVKWSEGRASSFARAVAHAGTNLVEKAAHAYVRAGRRFAGAVASAAHKAWNISKHGISAAVHEVGGAAHRTGSFFKSLWHKTTGVVGAIAGKVRRGISTGLHDAGHWIGKEANKVGAGLLSAARYVKNHPLQVLAKVAEFSNPVGLAIAAAKYGWGKYGKQITSFAKAAWQATKHAAKAVGHFIQSPVGQLIVSGLSVALTFVPGGMLLKAGIGAAMGAIEAYSKGGNWKQILAGAAMGGLEGAVPFLKGGLAIATKVGLGAAKGVLPKLLDGKHHGWKDYAEGLVGGVASQAGGDLLQKFGGGKLLGKAEKFLTGNAGTKGVLGKIERSLARSGALQKALRFGKKFAPKIIKGAAWAYDKSGKVEKLAHGLHEFDELAQGGLEGSAWIAGHVFKSKEWQERLEHGAQEVEGIDTWVKKVDKVAEATHHYLGVGLRFVKPGNGQDGVLNEKDLDSQLHKERLQSVARYRVSGKGDVWDRLNSAEFRVRQKLSPLEAKVSKLAHRHDDAKPGALALLALKVHGKAEKASAVLEKASETGKKVQEGLENVVLMTDTDEKSGTLAWIHEHAETAEKWTKTANTALEFAHAATAVAGGATGLGLRAAGHGEIADKQDERAEKYADRFYEHAGDKLIKHPLERLKDSRAGKRVDGWAHAKLDHLRKMVHELGEREKDWEYKKQLHAASRLGRWHATHGRRFRSDGEKRDVGYRAGVEAMKGYHRHVARDDQEHEERGAAEHETLAERFGKFGEDDRVNPLARALDNLAGHRNSKAWRIGGETGGDLAEEWESHEHRHGGGEGEENGPEEPQGGAEREVAGPEEPSRERETPDAAMEHVGRPLAQELEKQVEHHGSAQAAQIEGTELQAQHEVHAENQREHHELAHEMAHHARERAEHPEQHAHELAAHQEELDAHPDAPEHALEKTVDGAGVAGGSTPPPAVAALPLVASPSASPEPPPAEHDPVFGKARSLLDRLDARVDRESASFHHLAATDAAKAQELHKSVMDVEAAQAEAELERLSRVVGEDPYLEEGLSNLAARHAAAKGRLTGVLAGKTAPVRLQGKSPVGAKPVPALTLLAHGTPAHGASAAGAPEAHAPPVAHPDHAVPGAAPAAHPTRVPLAHPGTPIPGAGSGDVAYLGEPHEDTWIGSGAAGRPIAEGLANDFHFGDSEVNEPTVGGELARLGSALGGLAGSLAGAAQEASGLAKAVGGSARAVGGIASDLGSLVGQKDNAVTRVAGEIAGEAGKVASWLKQGAGALGKAGGVIEKYTKQQRSSSSRAKPGSDSAAGLTFLKSASGETADGPAPVADAGAYADEPKRLDYGVMAGMERFLGTRLSDVKIHTGPGAELITKRFDAEAVTIREHIFFAPGRFSPQSFEGRKLLAHELTHVAQRGRPNLDTRTAEEEAHRAEASYGAPGMEILDLSKPQPDFVLNMAGAEKGLSAGPRTAKKERSISHGSSSQDNGIYGEELLDQVGERVHEMLLKDLEDDYESR